MELAGIEFIDLTGQRFNFAVDAEDGINSLVLKPVQRGVHTLCVNGESERYYFRPTDILLFVQAPVAVA